MGLQGAHPVVPGSRDKVTLKTVKYTGDDALLEGYAVCYDRDNITAVGTPPSRSTLAASSESWARHRYVEKPATANLSWFAGVVSRAYDAVTGGQFIEIVCPEGSVTNIYTDANCAINATRLGVQAGSYAFGTAGEANCVALQTVDRSSTNGLVQAQVQPVTKLEASSFGVPSSSNNVFSNAIWGAAPFEDVVLGRRRGNAIFEDFKDGCKLATNQASTELHGSVSGFTATTGNTLAHLATNADGELVLSGTTADEDLGIAIGGGGNVAGGFKVTATTKLWMEARVQVLNTTTATSMTFLGFGEEALNGTLALLEADNTRTDTDYFGFLSEHDSTTGIDLIHNTAGGGGETALSADAGTFAAATWTNLGISSDGTTVTFWQDGVSVGSVLVAATNFPDGEELTWYFQMSSVDGSTFTIHIDWVKILYLPA